MKHFASNPAQGALGEEGYAHALHFGGGVAVSVKADCPQDAYLKS